MRHWKIADAEVLRAMEVPDDVTPSYHGRKNAWKRRGEGWLRVTYAEEARSLVVVTVTPLEKKPRRRKR